MGQRLRVREFTFDQQFGMSVGVTAQLETDLLLKHFDAVAVTRASIEQDKTGVDFWVTLKNNKRIGIDVKIRDHDFGKDDLALETWSVIETGKVGWTRDPQKQTDYIVWYWKDTKRYCIVPYLLLRKAFIQHWQAWRALYKSALQTTRQNGAVWQSECVFVPRNVVWRAIYEISNGIAAF